MNHLKKNFYTICFLGFILFSTTICSACQTNCPENSSFPLSGISFFSPRSQSANAALRITAHHNFRHKLDSNSFNGTLTITPFYGHSFKTIHLANYFFGQDHLTLTGSMIENRAINHILADYFGLSPSFNGTVCLNPKISNFLLDFDLFIDLYKIYNGLYFQFYTPLTKTKWQICLCETNNDIRIPTPYPTGYMTEEEINAPLQSIVAAMKGETTWGDLKEGIKFGKIDGAHCQTKFADINLILGYLLINRERGYIGLNLRTVAPTGTRPCSNFLFEPVVGNGRHWELGVGLTGRVLIWEKDGDQTLDFHVDANFTHLFRTKQRRSFDFTRNGFGSRYILLKEFDSAGLYTGNLFPAINKTTLYCNVTVDCQADFVFMFAYNNKNWDFDFGYNGWIRSREKICLRESIEPSKFGLKGIQNVAGVGANLTQSTATLYGNNMEAQEDVADRYTIFIDTEDLCAESAASPKAFTHKLFTNLSYARKTETCRMIPYIGLGGQIEFESQRPKCQQSNKPTLSQWGIWTRLGVAFN